MDGFCVDAKMRAACTCADGDVWPGNKRDGILFMNTHKNDLWVCFIVVSLIALIVLPLLPPPYGGAEMLIAAIGGIWALAFYRQQRHAEDARFMKDLMREFNERYNKLNGSLQQAIWSPDDFSDKQRLEFIDYFNLCAEEWVFWKKGYIDESIWRAWRCGMAFYGQDPRVKKIWESERGPSYYGFELPE